MGKEPVILGQLGMIIALISAFSPPVRDAITSVGGAEGFGAAITAVVGFVTYIVRNRVSPVK